MSKCGLCKAELNRYQCAVCGLGSGDNPNVTPLHFGKHKGKTVAQVYEVAPSYLSWMIRTKVGTPAQLAKARLLLQVNSNSVTGIEHATAAKPVVARVRIALDDRTNPPDLKTFVRSQQEAPIYTPPRFAPVPLAQVVRPLPITEPVANKTNSSNVGSWVAGIIIIAVAGLVILGLLNSTKSSTYASQPQPVAARPSPTAATAAPVIARPPTSDELSAEGKLTYETESCRIKGNVSFNTGEKIYHILGGRFYKETVIDPRYGERWFCTESDALANGWRKSSQ